MRGRNRQNQDLRRRSHPHRLSVAELGDPRRDDAVTRENAELAQIEDAERIVDALRTRGVPVAYLAFEGEQHGFRRAETIVRAREAELYFYGRVLGFEPADTLDPVAIDNLE